MNLETRFLNKNNRHAGFSLLETIVAISVLMLTIVGPLSLASKGIIYADYVKDEITGFYLAQEAIETIRNIRDANIKNNRPWTDGIENCIDDGTARGCRLDIWNYTEPNKGITKCDTCVDDNDRKNFEKLRVVDVGSGAVTTGAAPAIKLYGRDFSANITAGQTPKDSIYARRIVIKNATSDYLTNPAVPVSDRGLLRLDPSGIDEVNITVEATWKSGGVERRVKVSENMFSI